MFYGHIGGMDVTARALLIAEKMITDGRVEKAIADRYAGWKSPEAQSILAGKVSLDDLAAQVLAGGADPRPVSGRQEYMENLLNAFI